MKIAMIALGSRGDVQPYVALGSGLSAAGHTVTILAASDFRDLITAYGLQFVDMGASLQTVVQGEQALFERGQMLQILSSMRRTAEQLARQAAMRGLAACEGAEAIMGGLGGLFVGLALAEKLGIPFIPAHLLPFTPTRAFPSVLTPLPPGPLTAWANWWSHRLAQQMMWQPFRPADNQVRAEILHLGRAPVWGPYAAAERPGQLVLYGYSPQVLPRPADWGAGVHVTGYWLLDAPAGWQPPSGLQDFLAAGPPPVYVGFGSMPSQRPQHTAEMVLQALARTGQRGVLSAGWGGLKPADLPETVYLAGSLPHTWLFPRTAAVVHHGGAGTTAAGLWAGVPSVLTPYFGDQPFWARRVYDLGVGPKPIARRRLTADSLAEAIGRAVSDTAMQGRAASLGERIRAEDGVARAVAALAHHLSA